MQDVFDTLKLSAAPWAFLGLAILVALIAAGLIVLLRRLGPIERLVFKGIRPWACDVCMSFWTLLVVAPLFGGGVRGYLVAPPAFALCLWVLRQITQPVSDFHPPPEESR